MRETAYLAFAVTVQKKKKIFSLVKPKYRQLVPIALKKAWRWREGDD